jgi:hypothetical protein
MRNLHMNAWMLANAQKTCRQGELHVFRNAWLSWTWVSHVHMKITNTHACTSMKYVWAWKLKSVLHERINQLTRLYIHHNLQTLASNVHVWLISSNQESIIPLWICGDAIFLHRNSHMFTHMDIYMHNINDCFTCHFLEMNEHIHSFKQTCGWSWLMYENVTNTSIHMRWYS